MNVADFIVKYLTHNVEVQNSYGYPGSLAGFVMEALRNAQKDGEIIQTLLPTEQACSFAAIGNSLISKKPTLCWTTSGPGATNLITGIADAFYDSVPVIFLTSNVETASSVQITNSEGLRQNGNQETDIVAIAKSITKAAIRIDQTFTAQKIIKTVEEVCAIATADRPGPVLIDLPIDISKKEFSEFANYEFGNIEPIVIKANHFQPFRTFSEVFSSKSPGRFLEECEEKIAKAKRPVILFGGGVHQSSTQTAAKNWALKARNLNPLLKITVTMNAKDLFSAAEFGGSNPCEGVIGVWGNQEANLAVQNADLLITFGSRLSNRQLAAFGSKLPANLKAIVVDIDNFEKARHFQIESTTNQIEYHNFDLKDLFETEDQTNGQFCETVVTADVGQNMWRVCKDFEVKNNQRILFSAGAGTMGCSLPTAIGAFNALENTPIHNASVVAFVGDGGLQMSLENLNYIAKNKLPIAVVLFNNNSLGLIKAFQTRNFNQQYFSTTPSSGYQTPNFKKIAKAIGFKYLKVKSTENINEIYQLAVQKLNAQSKKLFENSPIFIEVITRDVFPK